MYHNPMQNVQPGDKGGGKKQKLRYASEPPRIGDTGLGGGGGKKA